MRRIRDRVAGLDVHRDVVAACTQIYEGGQVAVDKQRFATTRAGLAKLAEWLIEHRVRCVAMEATGVYWKPVYYALEGLFDELWLCNAHHVKNVPERKTDMSDAEWLADVAAHGMVRPSFVPPPPIRQLRELTRYRKTQVDARAREIQRLEKVLQDAGIKLSSVASKVWTKSGRAMVEALFAREMDPVVLAELAQSRMRSKMPGLTEALAGNFSLHHGAVARRILDHIEFLDRSIAILTDQITERLGPFEPAVALRCTIPGVSRPTAEVIIAETGGDMARFPTAQQLCAWAGVAPANHESAGKRRSGGTRPGGQWLRRALIESARSAARTRDTYLAAQYRRIARRRGPNKAAVAVAHSILTAAGHVLSAGQVYDDLGSDYLERRHDSERRVTCLARQLEQAGYHVSLERAA
ncbi:MAG TPA: IS110 family transposase [Acidimicrobiales bacterium]|nr:IS110 family transposase [Acidimicrobiales bacterium]